MFTLLRSVLSQTSDCNQVKAIASDLNWNNWNDPPNCCTFTGITCNSNRVVQISWGEMALSGTLDCSHLPTELQWLDLNSNQITGLSSCENGPNSLIHLDLSNNEVSDVEYLPRKLRHLNISGNTLSQYPPLSQILTHLDVSGNLLSGGIPALPLTLTHLNCYGNRLAGTIPSIPSNLTFLNLANQQGSTKLTGSLPILPYTLEYLDLKGNQISGNISNIPSKISYIDLSYNLITGQIPSLPTRLQVLNLNFNRMTGDTPIFPNSLLYLNLGGPNNRFTGTITIFKPVHLDLSGNHISDVIVLNSSMLVVCDLSNNPFLNYVNVLSLTMCTKNGLYSPTILPFKTSTPSRFLLTGTGTRSPQTFTTSQRSSATTYMPVTQITQVSFSTSISLSDPVYLPSALELTYDMNSLFLTASESFSEFGAPPSIATQISTPLDAADTSIIYILIGGLIGLFILLVLLKSFIKNPSSKSKFGRKNSFGTLNTVNTNKTQQ